MKTFKPGQTLSLYGESVAISKVELIDQTQLIFWHSQNSLLCGLQINTPQTQKNITFNLS